MSYLDLLETSAKQNGSIVCMGLDPVVEALPKRYRTLGISGAVLFLEELFDEMLNRNVLPGAYKANLGFYSRHNSPRDWKMSVDDRYAGYGTLSRL